MTTTSFLCSFSDVQKTVHQIAREKGWHDKEPRNDGEMIALMHSELSEALEALRHGNNPSEHIPSLSGLEEELADVIIRIMDFAELRGLSLAEAIIEKIKYNSTREYMHGNKKF